MLTGGWAAPPPCSCSISYALGSMMSMLTNPVRPIRTQAAANARRMGQLAMTQRDVAASRQCGDIPTETLSLSKDFVVINKVSAEVPSYELLSSCCGW